MGSVVGQIPPWAVFVLMGAVSFLLSILWAVFSNRYTRIEYRVDKTEEQCSNLKAELGKKADYRHLEKEVEKLAARNHSDLKDIQKQIADSMKTMHGRLDDLHIVILNFLNGGNKDK